MQFNVIPSFNTITIELLTEQHLEFVSFTGGCTGSSESIHVKMPISGSVVECLTRDRGAAGSGLTGATVLCP